jgi:hypothetical protein
MCLDHETIHKTYKYEIESGRIIMPKKTPDELRDQIANQYINRLEYLYAECTKPKKKLLNLAYGICTEIRRAKASLVTNTEQRELVAKMEAEKKDVKYPPRLDLDGVECTESETTCKEVDDE